MQLVDQYLRNLGLCADDATWNLNVFAEGCKLTLEWRQNDFSGNIRDMTPPVRRKSPGKRKRDKARMLDFIQRKKLRMVNELNGERTQCQTTSVGPLNPNAPSFEPNRVGESPRRFPKDNTIFSHQCTISREGTDLSDRCSDIGPTLGMGHNHDSGENGKSDPDQILVAPIITCDELSRGDSLSAEVKIGPEEFADQELITDCLIDVPEYYSCITNILYPNIEEVATEEPSGNNQGQLQYTSQQAALETEPTSTSEGYMGLPCHVKDQLNIMIATRSDCPRDLPCAALSMSGTATVDDCVWEYMRSKMGRNSLSVVNKLSVYRLDIDCRRNLFQDYFIPNHNIELGAIPIPTWYSSPTIYFIFKWNRKP